jgi:hypothetical protein
LAARIGRSHRPLALAAAVNGGDNAK